MTEKNKKWRDVKGKEAKLCDSEKENEKRR